MYEIQNLTPHGNSRSPFVCVPSDASRFSAALRALRARMLEEGATYGDEPVPTLPIPVILPHAVWTEAHAVIRSLSALLEKAALIALTDDSLEDFWRLTDDEKLLLRKTEWPKRLAPLMRFDCMYAGGELQVMEVNTIFAGLAPSDAIAEIVAGLDEISSWKEEFGPIHHPLSPKLAHLIGSAEGAVESGRQSTFALIGHTAAPIASEYRYTLKRLAREGARGGALASVAEIRPDRAGRIRVRDCAVDTLYLRGTFPDWQAHPEVRDGVVRAVESGSLHMINPFESLLIDSKAALAVLHHPSFQAGLDPAQLETIRRHVPYTRLIPPHRGGEDEREVFDALKCSRDAYVLKPVDGYGGAGVVVGRRCEQPDWDGLLDNLSGGRYVAQRYVEDMPAFVPAGALPGVDHLYININLVASEGVLAGGFARGSSEPVVNIAQSGALLPLYAGQAAVQENSRDPQSV